MAITIDGTDGFSSDNSALKFDTSVFVIDETNNRIGVNTASPSQALDVTGDIEVSGGVYLGGTGAANYLDDYEEGTWTPYIEGSTGAGTATYPTQGGYYTKIGRQVNLAIRLNWTGHTGTGDIKISGFPFATKSDGSYEAVGAIMIQNISFGTGYDQATTYTSGSRTYANIFVSDSSGSGWGVASMSASGGLRISLTYFTD